MFGTRTMILLSLIILSLIPFVAESVPFPRGGMAAGGRSRKASSDKSTSSSDSSKKKKMRCSHVSSRGGGSRKCSSEALKARKDHYAAKERTAKKKKDKLYSKFSAKERKEAKKEEAEYEKLKNDKRKNSKCKFVSVRGFRGRKCTYDKEDKLLEAKKALKNREEAARFIDPDKKPDCDTKKAGGKRGKLGIVKIKGITSPLHFVGKFSKSAGKWVGSCKPRCDESKRMFWKNEDKKGWKCVYVPPSCNVFCKVGRFAKKVGKGIAKVAKGVVNGVKNAAVGLGKGVAGFASNLVKGKVGKAFKNLGKAALNGLDLATTFIPNPVGMAAKAVGTAVKVGVNVAKTAGKVSKAAGKVAEKVTKKAGNEAVNQYKESQAEQTPEEKQ